MRIAGHKFRKIGAVKVKRRQDGSIWTDKPQARYKKAATTELHAYGGGTFCKFTLEAAPQDSGVYLMIRRGKVQYVGEAENLRRRFGSMGYGGISPRNCFKGGQQTNCRINQLILGVLQCGGQIDIWFCPCEDCTDLKRRLKASLEPPWNL